MPGAVRIFPEPVPYLMAWEIQSRLHEERLLDLQSDTVLILEHPPVYTLGRRTRLSHWGGSESALCQEGAELHHVNRGGSVTFHGPGQIVVYPSPQARPVCSGAQAFGLAAGRSDHSGTQSLEHYRLPYRGETRCVDHDARTTENCILGHTN